MKYTKEMFEQIVNDPNFVNGYMIHNGLEIEVNMENWGDVNLSRDCGTAACLSGHASVMFDDGVSREIGLDEFEDREYGMMIREVFSMTGLHPQHVKTIVLSIDGELFNLNGVNLRKANLNGVNLSQANLSWADLGSAKLEGANMEGVNMEGANLKGANLKGANLKGANMEGVNLSEANLNWADLGSANLSRADLENANLKSANLKGAKLG